MGTPVASSSPSPAISRRKPLLLVILLLRPLPSSHHQRRAHSHHSTHLHPNNTTRTVPILTARLESEGLNPFEIPQIHARLLRTNSLPFPSAIHWNRLIRAYLRHDPRKALHLYSIMSRNGDLPDSYTLPMALKAASRLHSPALGRQLHSTALKLGLASHEFCESGLLAVYAKSCDNDDFQDARKVFDGNPQRRLGSWNALMSGLSQAGRPQEVLTLFSELRRAGGRPDDVTMVSVLSACGTLGDLDLGLQLHKCTLQAEDRGIDDISMWNSLVDMYGKCGRTDLAYRVFSRMPRRNVSTWTTMITAFAMHGHVDDALWCFQEMRQDGVSPNRVTFLSLLGACAHGGLVDEAMAFFKMMEMDYDIEPTVAHYGCMVDVLGRVGRLEDARGMVERMPMRANAVIFGTILGACEKHGNVEVGKWAAGWLIELEPWSDGVYVVLSNIYANAEMWEDVEVVRGLMKDRKVSKMPAFSSPAVLT